MSQVPSTDKWAALVPGASKAALLQGITLLSDLGLHEGLKTAEGMARHFRASEKRRQESLNSVMPRFHFQA